MRMRRCVQGAPTRHRPLGQMRVQVIPAGGEDFSEPLGSIAGSITGDVALAHLGPTPAERATLRAAHARAAEGEATLASFGIRPRR